MTLFNPHRLVFLKTARYFLDFIIILIKQLIFFVCFKYVRHVLSAFHILYHLYMNHSSTTIKEIKSKPLTTVSLKEIPKGNHIYNRKQNILKLLFSHSINLSISHNPERCSLKTFHPQSKL